MLLKEAEKKLEKVYSVEAGTPDPLPVSDEVSEEVQNIMQQAYEIDVEQVVLSGRMLRCFPEQLERIRWLVVLDLSNNQLEVRLFPHSADLRMKRYWRPGFLCLSSFRPIFVQMVSAPLLVKILATKIISLRNLLSFSCYHWFSLNFPCSGSFLVSESANYVCL